MRQRTPGRDDCRARASGVLAPASCSPGSGQVCAQLYAAAPSPGAVAPLVSTVPPARLPQAPAGAKPRARRVLARRGRPHGAGREPSTRDGTQQWRGIAACGGSACHSWWLAGLWLAGLCQIQRAEHATTRHLEDCRLHVSAVQLVSAVSVEDGAPAARCRAWARQHFPSVIRQQARPLLGTHPTVRGLPVAHAPS